MSLPRIGITVGDPAGIGPEIAEQAADDSGVRAVCTPVLYRAGDARGTVPVGAASAGAGRSAYDAVLKAREYVAGGKRWVVDMDLEKFFDRVNHDVLMARVARTVKDKRVLRLVRRYLEAGVMDAGLVSPTTEGTGMR
jgi:hypothetical protein